MSSTSNPPPRIAIVGAGIAGAACAAGLLRAGFDVTVFDKSRGVGGRMATRRAQWTDVDGSARSADFDHGCPHFTAKRPRFRAVVERAEALGCVARWRQQVYCAFPAARTRKVFVPTPGMPAFGRHLLTGVALRLGHAVTGLQRCPQGWLLHLADGSVNGRIDGPFEHVLLAIPAAQAAMLLSGHQTDWADALDAVRMEPCWTLMAVTDEVDWPWDAAELERGPLARIARNDRAPGRRAAGGWVPWVAHATPAWSFAHLEDDPAQVAEALRTALGKSIAGVQETRWHHVGVHRWRYARLAQRAPGSVDCWWRSDLGLGVCGDAFGDSFGAGSVEAAWSSGDELADAVAASFDAAPAAAVSPEAELADSAH